MLALLSHAGLDKYWFNRRLMPLNERTTRAELFKMCGPDSPCEMLNAGPVAISHDSLRDKAHVALPDYFLKIQVLEFS